MAIATDARHPGLPVPWVPYAAAWTVVFAVYTGLFAAQGVPVGMAARGAAATALPAAVVGIAALGLAGRWPWPTAGRWRHAARLIAAILGLAVLSIGLWLAILEADFRVFNPAGHRPTAPIVAWQFMIDCLLLLSLVGVGYARTQAEALREAAEREARADALRARAELALLRSQVQPHFILNVLHALLGLVRRDPARAEEALERLGELLRFGQELHGGDGDRVPLSREWEFVGSFLELERLRLGGRLRLEVEAEPAALAVPVPPFSLQPLVENAIAHGVAPRAEGGCVRVSARRTPVGVLLSVWDDGPGAREAEIAASPRMGLRLVRERLAALYDGSARLSFARPAGGGFEARLELPDAARAERS